MVRFAAFVFGSLMTSLPPTGVDLFVDAELSGSEVQVLPPKGQQFSPAHSGGQLQQEQLVHSLRLGLNEEPLDLLLGQDFHLLALQGRQLASDGRVAVDQPLLYCLVQRHLADGVAASHRAVR